jgi:hypothetical protein
MKAQLIRVNEEPKEITPENGTDFGLQELYRTLECDLIQTIMLDENTIMIMDEEGKFRGEPNLTATTIAQGRIFAGDWVAGHVIVCPSNMLR